MEGKRQETAAAAAGMSVRSARKWERGLYPSHRRKPHLWRTREDPFADAFESEVVPLLAADHKGVLEATTILAELNRRHPERFSESQLRTLQRRVRQWRALNGPDKEVFFPQEHPPGREAAYDFTNCDELGVTIGGAPFDHLLLELGLSFSGWRWPTVAPSESFEALALDEQEALWRLGGVVEVLRSDNLSAATHELALSGGRALTKRYGALLEHYGMRSTRIFPRKAHENGVVEQAHRRTESILAQMLVPRGNRDFPSVEEYQHWVREVIEREHNALLGKKLAEEQRHLHPLPAIALPAYTTLIVKVRRWSKIRDHTYSVPARLIGERVRVLMHHDHPYTQRLALVRAVRTRGDRRAHPRQDRRLKAQGHLDGRPGAARVRGARAPVGHKRSRSHDRETPLHALLRARQSRNDAQARDRVRAVRRGGEARDLRYVLVCRARIRARAATPTIGGDGALALPVRSVVLSMGACRRGSVAKISPSFVSTVTVPGSKTSRSARVRAPRRHARTVGLGACALLVEVWLLSSPCIECAQR
jgi:hypothetical protein